MPRVVDHDGRRQQIARAALRLLARDGTAGLTIRGVARELGGSLTVVTHYYASRQDLILDLATQLCTGWRAELVELEASVTDPPTRLRMLLEWLLPLTEDAHEEERARFALLMDKGDPGCAAVLREFDEYVREELRGHLVDVVPTKHLQRSVDLLRAFTNGVVLDEFINPEAWPAKRQLDLLDVMMNLVMDSALLRKT